MLVAVAIVTLTALGLPVVLALDKRARGGALAALAFLYGCGLAAFAAFSLSVIGIPWTAANVLGVALLGAIACGIAARRRRVSPAVLPMPTTSTAATITATSSTATSPIDGTAAGDRIDHAVDGGEQALPMSVTAAPLAAHAIDALTLFTVFAYAIFATAARVWEWDFWAIWGLKARVFYENRGIDWHFLQSPWNDFSHPDYPLLVPLNDVFVALLSGGWDDRWLGLMSVAFAGALLLVVRAEAGAEVQPVFAASIALAAAAFACSPDVGMAEGPLIAIGGAAVLFLRRAVIRDDAAAMRHAAVLLGLAASCKNEGLALLIAAAVSVAIVAPRRLVRLWPAVAIVLPWLALRSAHGLTSDITRGSIVSRVLERLPESPSIFRQLFAQLGDKPVWFLLVLSLLIVPWRRVVAERLVLLVTAVQFAAFVAAYFVTTRDVSWHITWSWSRLPPQVATPLLFSVMVMLARYGSGSDDRPHAEARSDL